MFQKVKCFFGMHKFEDVEYRHTFTRRNGTKFTIFFTERECVNCGVLSNPKATKKPKINFEYDDLDYCC